jgi:uracil-DNA glycosylase
MNWDDFIKEEAKKDYYKQLVAFVSEDANNHTIYPKHKDLFNAFKRCPIDKIKCVILAQDPYILEGQAHGLAFSVPLGIKTPPSLRNIYKELKDDLNIDPPNHGCLYSWAEQGVLLLNSVMTVRANESGSHKQRGWETFTDAAIKLIDKLDRPICFLLWGNYAKAKRMLITNEKHLVIESGHPSPYSSHLFFGSKPFSKVNEFLIKNGIEPIDWSVK